MCVCVCVCESTINITKCYRWLPVMKLVVDKTLICSDLVLKQTSVLFHAADSELLQYLKGCPEAAEGYYSSWMCDTVSSIDGPV